MREVWLSEAIEATTTTTMWGEAEPDPADLLEEAEERLLQDYGSNVVGICIHQPHQETYQPQRKRIMNVSNKTVFEALAAAQPATAALVARTWANSASCALIGMVATTVARELKAATQGATRQPGYLPEPGPTIDAFNEERDLAHDDNDASAPIGMDPKITLDQLVEWTAAVRAYSEQLAGTLGGQEKRFAEPQAIRDSFDFMCTPRTSVTKDQIEAVQEEEPELTNEQVIKLLQSMAIDDAARLKANGPITISKVEELLAHAPSDREMNAIWEDLPEAYREGMVSKATTSIEKELGRTLVLAIRGVPGISSKRKILKADLPTFEKLVHAA